MLLVKGVVSFSKKTIGKKIQKDPKLTVLKVYPFLLTR